MVRCSNLTSIARAAVSATACLTVGSIRIFERRPVLSRGSTCSERPRRRRTNGGLKRLSSTGGRRLRIFGTTITPGYWKMSMSRARWTSSFSATYGFSGTLNRTLERFGSIDFRKNGYSLYLVLSGRILSVVPSFNWGDGVFFSDEPFLGRSSGGNVIVIYRPTSRLRTDFRAIFSRFVDPRDDSEVFDVKILRNRLTYQFTDRFLLRHILEHNTSSRSLGNNLLLTYRINTGTVVFVGYDDRYQQGSRNSRCDVPNDQSIRTDQSGRLHEGLVSLSILVSGHECPDD